MNQPTEATGPGGMPEDKSQATLTRLAKYLPALLIGHMFVTVPTLIISLALAYATFVQADATRKIQRSETWPFVSYGTSNISPEGTDVIAFDLANDGVGPARLKAIEFRYDGRPMTHPRGFLQQCCGDSPANPTPFMSSPVDGVLRPGETTHFIRLVKSPANAAIWDRLQVERWKVTIRACYCSIFDDCWVLETPSKDPRPVDICPADWTRFEERPYSRAAAAARS